MIAPTISNSQKIKKEFGDLFSSKNPTKYEASSGKESTMDQELEICNRVYELATYNKSRVCVTIKKYNVNKPPYIRLFTARENEDLKQVAYVNYTLNELSELSKIVGYSMFLDNCEPQ